MYGETFMTILAIVFLIFGVLQIILFFKIWGMTNRVNDIYNLLNGEGGLEEGCGYEYLIWYSESIIKKAKRMTAIGDKGAERILRGLIYDLEEFHENSKSASYFSEYIIKYKKLAQEALDEMQK